MTMRLAFRAVIVLALSLAALAGPAAPSVFAATTFDAPTATSSYGSSVVFTQPITTTRPMKRAEILLEFPGAPGPDVVEVADALTEPGRSALDYSLDAPQLLPNTTIKARWRLTSVDGTIELGPAVTVRYDDTRFTWKVRAGPLVRVHWYKGSDAFGKRALDIGEKGIRDAAALLGVTETEPIDFFIYADQQAFYQALGPRTPENVGGQANAEIRTLFGLITPGEIDADWVDIVIRHELTHLAFNTAVDNAYHFPPRWLNEGLAVYLSEGYGADNRTLVRDAANDGTLMPLDAIAGDFPATRDRFFLAYAESVSSLDYLVRTYGRDKLVALIRSYARGLTDDEAFKAALGVDVATFDTAWRAELKARQPTVHGPGPAPPGPLPSGWTQADGSAGVPLASGAPGPTGVPASGATAPSSPATGPGRGGSTVPIIIATLGLLVAIVVVGYGVARPRRRPLVAIAPQEAAPVASSVTEPPPGGGAADGPPHDDPQPPADERRP
jgi:peptidase MA superfamily protein